MLDKTALQQRFTAPEGNSPVRSEKIKIVLHGFFHQLLRRIAFARATGINSKEIDAELAAQRAPLKDDQRAYAVAVQQGAVARYGGYRRRQFLTDSCFVHSTFVLCAKIRQIVYICK